MTKRKLQRFAEIATFDNVFQRDCPLKGKWNSAYFKNENPITLELGCGRGEYTVEMARFSPERNFIGADLKGARLWRGAKTAIEEHMQNVAFLRIQIEWLPVYFEKEEIAEIWITFPDPQPQLSREKKRLTSKRFLNYYRSVLKPGGIVHLKTDNEEFFQYTLEMIKEHKLNLLASTSDLYNSSLLNEVLSIKTTYEKVYLKAGKKICYLSFCFDE